VKKNYLKLFSATGIWAFFNGYLVPSLSHIGKLERKPEQASGAAFGMITGIVGAFFAAAGFFLKSWRTGENPFAGLNRKQLAALAGLGIITGAANVCWYTALGMGHVANAALVHSLAYPLSVLPLIFFLKEKLRPLHVAAIGLGFAGVLAIAWPKNGAHFGVEAWLGFTLLSVMGLIGEIFFSTLLGEGHLNVPNRVSAFAKLLFQIPTMFLGARILGQSLAFSSSAALTKGVLGGLLLYVSFILVFGSLGREEDGKVPGRDFGIIGYTERIGTVALGILVFGETLTKNILIGGACMLAAELLVMMGARNGKSK